MSLTAGHLRDHEKQHRSPSRRSSVQPMSPEGSPQNQPFSPTFAAFQSDTGSERAHSHDGRKPRASVAPSSGENVKVICRVRPFSKREYEIQDDLNAKIADEWDKVPLRSVIEMRGNSTIFLDHDKDFDQRNRFEFDVSLWSIPREQQDGDSFATQEDVYQCVGAPAIEHVWNGYNTCIFAYGQTGSGKTHTMMGNEEQRGLIPRMCKGLFESLEERREEDDGVVVENTVKEYRMEAHFLEIYNERVKDLLWELRDPRDSPADNIDKDNLKVRNIGKEGPVVVGLTNVQVKSWEDCLKLIEEGTSHRSVAATKMNETSSRSHSIFRLSFIQTTKVLPTKQFEKPKTYDRISTVSLVDLAGSERNKKTGAEGARMKEAVAINLSLTSLKNVIDALVDGRSRVPYRDSQLTWLLSESLGGNSKTFMISCVSPHWDNAEETLNTLRYAMRAQSIVNNAIVNESDELKKMNTMKAQLEELQRRMSVNPDEGNLKKAYEEQQLLLKQRQEEALQREAEARKLEAHMEETKKMQFNAAYTHQFKLIMCRRVAALLNEAVVKLEQETIVKRKEVDAARSAATRADAECKTVATEAEIAKNQMERLIARREEIKTKSDSFEHRKRELLVKGEQLRADIDKKQNLKREARRVARILIGWETVLAEYRLDQQTAKDRRSLSTVSENEEARRTEMKTAHENKMEELRERLESLKTQVKSSSENYTEQHDTKSKRIAKLHSEAIFYENENKRFINELEESLSDVNLGGSKHFFEERAELQQKLDELQRERRDADAVRHKENRVKEIVTRSEIKHEIRDIELDGEREYERVLEQFKIRERTIRSQSVETAKQLDKLNDDTKRYLVDIRPMMPRYATVAESLESQVEGKQTHHDSLQLVQKYRSVGHGYRSHLPSKFVKETGLGAGLNSSSSARNLNLNVSVSSASALATPQRVHSTPSTPRAAPGTPRGQSRTPGSPVPIPPLKLPERKTTRISSLEAPKQYYAQPTRTSLLRTQVQNYRKVEASPAIQAAAAAMAMSTPRTTTPSRSSTPRRPETAPRKIVVGGTYFMSRSRSPTSTRVASRSPPPSTTPVRETSSVTPRRTFTPR